MTATVLVDQRIFVTYSQAFVHSMTQETSGTFDFDYERPWQGQANGLCGAAEAGSLYLVTGTHTGHVRFRIERHPAEPPLDDGWEEIVEVSFSPTSNEVMFTALEAQDQHPLDLPRGHYRVRYCVRGMEHAEETEEPADTYLLQFWPGEPGPDRIVLQTGERAAYWHRAHRPLTPDEQTEQDRREAEARAATERERWGDRVPNERLRAVKGMNAHCMAKLDIDLEFSLAEADDSTHRVVAAWAALRALEQAGLADLPEIARAVAALRRGRPVPPPFDDPGVAWQILHDSSAPRTSVPVPPDGDYEQCPQNWAITTLFHTAAADSLTAVLDILVALAFVHGRDGYQQAFTEVWATFPQLGAD